MGALPRPDLPPGAQRDLNDALHELHHVAGWPSLRTLAGRAGCSHTTVSTVFSTPRLPSWGTLELLVEAMDGDTGHFHDLWLAASKPDGHRPTPTARIAGRRDELTAVRRHLETGTGLLLVTGEAGIGKTKLVEVASTAATDTFVAVGHCLPLATEAPLLPVADALRALHESDRGQWLEKALAECASYVGASLSLLVPELAPWEAAAPGDDRAGPWMIAALESVLRHLSAERRLALLLEDLHWADTATLDLVEHLVARGLEVPVIGTWRLDDQTIAGASAEWFNRVRRMPTVTTMTLAPLSRDGTREQLSLLTGHLPAPAVVDAIHGRTQGQPLFTEQLAAYDDQDRPLPSLLAELLDDRLGELTGPAWRAARALGVADRPLTTVLLSQITGLATADLVDGLHDLAARSLLAPSAGEETALRHPLLAEAIRRRLVAGEAEEEHAAVARALGSSASPEPAEVALHWQAAARPAEELVWRIRAARAAHERLALLQEGVQWARALDLWPPDVAEAGHPPTQRIEALVSALDLFGGIERERVAALAEEALALVPEARPLDAAELLLQAGFFLTDRGESDRALQSLQQAVELFSELPPCDGHVSALYALEMTLRGAGRHQEAAATTARGLEVSAELVDRRWYRTMLMQQAWYDAVGGDLGSALARAREAWEVEIPGPDPRGEARLAADHTDLLLQTAAGVEDVVTTGLRGLATAEAWDLDMFTVRVVRVNMAEALSRAGQVRRAAELIEPRTEGQRPSEDGWVLHVERARLDMLQGRNEAARDLVRDLRAISAHGFGARIELAECLAGVAVWTGEPETALEVALPLAEAAAPTEAAGELGPLLAVAARAAADGATDPSWLGRLTALRASCLLDPFAVRPVPADSGAWAATWRAELSRLANRQTVQTWVAAASEWDRLTRPHDAAYCRWRAAELALTTGQAALAKRLLRRAARDAREHVPLLEAVRATKSRAG